MEILLRKEYSKFINYWLILLLFLIGLIVIIGGLTRLTNSGLSITRWDIISGIFPPLNKGEWLEAFNLWHADGSFRTYRKILITQELIDNNRIIFPKAHICIRANLNTKF